MTCCEKASWQACRMRENHKKITIHGLSGQSSLPKSQHPYVDYCRIIYVNVCMFLSLPDVFVSWDCNLLLSDESWFLARLNRASLVRAVLATWFRFNKLNDGANSWLCFDFPSYYTRFKTMQHHQFVCFVCSCCWYFWLVTGTCRWYASMRKDIAKAEKDIASTSFKTGRRSLACHLPVERIECWWNWTGQKQTCVGTGQWLFLRLSLYFAGGVWGCQSDHQWSKQPAPKNGRQESIEKFDAGHGAGQFQYICHHLLAFAGWLEHSRPRYLI